MRNCRCCGRGTLTLWRGLHPTCYQRHRNRGTLDQFPVTAITGNQRAALRRDFAARYRAGESLDRLGQSVSKSAGFAKALLREAGVQLRRPGWGGAGCGGGASGEDARRPHGHMLLGPQPEQYPPLLPSDVYLRGAARAAVGKLLRAWYEAGADTALLAAATGRPYTWAWRMLRDAGTAKRPRGVAVVNPAVKALEDHIAARSGYGRREAERPTTETANSGGRAVCSPRRSTS